MSVCVYKYIYAYQQKVLKNTCFIIRAPLRESNVGWGGRIRGWAEGNRIKEKIKNIALKRILECMVWSRLCMWVCGYYRDKNVKI